MRFERSVSARTTTALAFILFALIAQETSGQGKSSLGFFITSQGPGNGANLGGLIGADAYCQTLAEAVGAGDRIWQAYLSVQAKDGQDAVNARDRIGSGPWQNALGVIVANNVEELHGANNLNKQTALNEKGEIVNGRGDSPNRHDILTGSQSDGTVVPGIADTTCGNWTSSGAGSAVLGHHDRQGGGTDPTSWNSAHNSNGCSQANLRSTGGDGLFYCFAIDRSTLLLIPLDDLSLTDPDARMTYVHDTLTTWIGDSNLDGEFNTEDLVAVFQYGEYEDAIQSNSSWVTGDWTGDKEFDTADLVLAFQDGGFELGTRPAVSAVPEPSSVVLLALGIMCMSHMRKPAHR
ncbi:MAG: PEP-CTERM sorting domain-containing protein [Planctomycetales bacterium]|nr:PEP-CTERM sorting domain-containing protein [Planctomycetales bacterium]MCA9169016.1 PEP-CTERM sorting domain-containing protein [Planctomycetales bacterium]